jgi:hypothetical protein
MHISIMVVLASLAYYYLREGDISNQLIFTSLFYLYFIFFTSLNSRISIFDVLYKYGFSVSNITVKDIFSLLGQMLILVLYFFRLAVLISRI